MRNIEEYKNKDVYIICDSKEDWKALVILLNTIYKGWRDSHWDTIKKGYHVSMETDCIRTGSIPVGKEIFNAKEFIGPAKPKVNNTYEIY